MLEVIAKFQTSLSSGISSSATSLVLVSNASADGDGETIPNGQYGFVIDEENSDREYVLGTVAGTNVTIDARGISVIDGTTEKSSNQYAHRKGASIKITDHPILTAMVDVFNGNEAFGGVPKLPASRVISNVRHLVDKEYADAIASSGITSMVVTDNGGITINVGAGTYLLNGTVEVYAGASNQALADDDTNYVQIVDGALDINVTGFDDDAIPLAAILTAAGDISTLADARPFYTAIDLLADHGLGRGATGIFIDLDPLGGLSFNSGKLGMDSVSGSITMFGGDAAPTGYLLCDGSAVSRETYSDLFAVIAEKYGVGDGSTTFNLPDFRGNVPVGKDGATFTDLGDSGGEEDHALSVSEMPAHTHARNFDTSSTGSAGYPYNGGDGEDATKLYNTGSAGGNEAHNNLQPYLTVNYIIKF